MLLIADRAVSLNPWWILAGIVLYELSQVVRTRGWFNILRAAYPDSPELRGRDVTAAYLAGAGVNAIVPARGGDFLKIFLVHRRLPKARYSTLIATFGPETIPEIAMSICLVIWALAHGFLPVPDSIDELPQFDVSFVIVHPLLSVGILAATAVGLYVVVRWARSRTRGLTAALRQGCEIMRSPRAFVLGVGGWQALSRIVRLAAMVCFMRATGLPVTVETAILVLAAQSAGRIVPFAPVSAGLRVAMLAYGFPALTDKPVDVASITSFWFTAGAVHLVGGLLISIGVLCFTFGTLSPRKAFAAVRAARVQTAAAAG
ncbi:MAG TPA: lysylphosphatidylglycerol synthase transmembrane domain-containing protein [Thermoleophilaceae bacterium]